MIYGTFQLGADVFEVIVDGNNTMFRDTSTSTVTSIEGLKLSKGGVMKEHPDLKDDEEWKKKAIKRLKEHIKSYGSELAKINYIKSELTKFGYSALFYQKAGWRTIKWRN